MFYGCLKCRKLTSVLILLAGVGYLLNDLGVWYFWQLSWYTVLFLILGITGLGVSHCKDCQATMDGKKR